MEAAIEFADVGIEMPRRVRKGGKGRRKRLRRFAGELRRTSEWQLQHLSFSVAGGESVAVVGRPDSGRDTVLRLAAGTLLPDRGTVSRAGAVVPMFDLPKALVRGFTVRQNIHLLGGLLGMTPTQVAEDLNGIVEFAGIAPYLDKYLGTMPSVLRPRMCFAVATTVPGEALAIEDMLTVGDPEFRAKCRERMMNLRAEGRTLLVVTDNTRQLRQFCSRAIYLRDGGVAADGPVPEILAAFRADMRRQGPSRRRRKGEEGAGAPDAPPA